jgi:asparagine synthase (glutamine-hydrolysing)
MCGILGANFISNGFNSALHLLKSRGPDNIDIATHKNNQFGHTRLSIIDLDARSNQPMEFDGIVIVFNGEIYNYKELIKEHNLIVETKSDTEVLIRLYQKYKYEFLDYLNGMFAFVIYDKQKDSFFCTRDRFGKKPFFYYYKDNKFIFSSKIKSILKILNTTLDFNQTALYEYLTFWSPLGENTFYENIYKLEAGHQLILKNNNLSVEEYYNYSNIENQFSNEIVILEDIEELIFKSIELRLNGDVDIASMLSGGLDSSLISALYSKVTGKKIDTYSIGYNEYLHYDETKYAKYVSKYINSNHCEIIIDKKEYLNTVDDVLDNVDEPFGDSAYIPTYILSKKISQDGFKVALSGEGSDEIFLGYDRYFNPQNNNSNFLPIHSTFTEEEKTKLLLNYKKKDYSYFQKYNDNSKQLSYINLKIWISNVLMSKVDEMSMANSLEVRSPFLDYNLVEYLFKTDSIIKQGDKSKYLLKKIASKYLPEDIINRNKKGFSSPCIEWLLDEYQDEIINTILKVNKEICIFDELFVRFIYNEAKDGRYKQHLWNLYIFARWFEKIYL